MIILDFSIFVKKIFSNNVVLWCSMIITLFLAGLPPPPCYKMLCFSWPPPPPQGHNVICEWPLLIVWKNLLLWKKILVWRTFCHSRSMYCIPLLIHGLFLVFWKEKRCILLLLFRDSVQTYSNHIQHYSKLRQKRARIPVPNFLITKTNSVITRLKWLVR